MVSLLLDYGLDVESKLPPAQDRCTAVFFAVARARNATLIKLLLKRGAKVQNAPGGGLFAAASLPLTDVRFRDTQHRQCPAGCESGHSGPRDSPRSSSA